ncbi:calcium-binding protein, partial [Shimia sp. R9_2]|uniref:calcium-binding protein n=1 Tax=Shimia sp. R9_2 TaxID=2821112 RepID=UPI001ADD5EB2
MPAGYYLSALVGYATRNLPSLVKMSPNEALGFQIGAYTSSSVTALTSALDAEDWASSGMTKGDATALALGIAAGIITSALLAAGTPVAVGIVASTAAALATEFAASQFIKHVYPKLHAAWEGLVDISSDFLDASVDYLAGVSDGIAEKIASSKEAIGKALNKFSEYISDIIDNIDEFLEEATEWAQDAWGDASEKVNSWLDDLDSLFNPPPRDPLVIDLDGDGIELTSLAGSSVFFDLDGDQFAERTGWVSPDDGLLVSDRNDNGTIDNISELMGSQNATGFSELAEFDTNGDGVINQSDTGYSDLKIWRDLDGDGVSGTGELSTLSDAGISEISLNSEEVREVVNGNDIVAKAKVRFEQGHETEVGEVLFDLSQAETSFKLSEDFKYDAEVFSMPMLRGFGEIPDLAISMSLNGELKQSAKDLIANVRHQGLANLDQKFGDFLIEWADVEDAEWMKDTGDLTAALVFDLDDYDSYNLGWANGDSPARPEIKGYIFFNPNTIFSNSGDEFRTSALEWLIDNGLYAPTIEQGPVLLSGVSSNNSSGRLTHIDTSLVAPTVNGESDGDQGPQRPIDFIRITSSDLAIDGSPNISGGSIAIAVEEHSPPLSAAELAFLQKLMGQDYSRGFGTGNVLSERNVMLYDTEDDQLDDLAKSFENARDHMSSRFLVQSARNIVAAEGENADLGNLAPFAALEVNPYQNDKIVGDAAKFVRDLIEIHRDGSSSTDGDALKILAKFVNDLPEIAAEVLLQFPDISETTVKDVLGIKGDIKRGSTDGDTLQGQGNDVILSGDGNDQLHGSNGSTLIHGGQGDDTIMGGAGSETILYHLGDGNDVISDHTYVERWADTLFLQNVSVGDASFANADGGNLVISFENGQRITVVGHFLNRVQDIEFIEFSDGTVLDVYTISQKTFIDTNGDGNDYVRGGYLSETISGGTGNDTLNGGDGADTYRYTLGDGNDVITDFSYFSDNDRIVLTDQDAADVTFLQNDDHDLVITMSNGDTLTVIDHFANIQEDMEEIEFADGTVLDLAGITAKSIADQNGEGDDLVLGGIGDDVFSGGTGNDTLNGGDGADTYRYTLGDGNDVITDFSYFSDNDRIVLTDQDAADVTFLQNDDHDLVITMSNGDTLTVIDHFANIQEDMEEIEFADG